MKDVIAEHCRLIFEDVMGSVRDGFATDNFLPFLVVAIRRKAAKTSSRSFSSMNEECSPR